MGRSPSGTTPGLPARSLAPEVEGDEPPGDILAIDEGSMLDTAALGRLQAVADAAGARVILMGDPDQLGSVGAGGMMRTAIDHHAETYTLSDVRRFDAEWEAPA